MSKYIMNPNMAAEVVKNLIGGRIISDCVSETEKSAMLFLNEDRSITFYSINGMFSIFISFDGEIGSFNGIEGFAELIGILR